MDRTICIVIQKECFREKGVHLFRFEEVWSKYPRCEELVRQLWNESSSLFNQMTNSIQGGQISMKRLINSKPWGNKEINY